MAVDCIRQQRWRLLWFYVTSNFRVTVFSTPLPLQQTAEAMACPFHRIHKSMRNWTANFSFIKNWLSRNFTAKRTYGCCHSGKSNGSFYADLQGASSQFERWKVLATEYQSQSVWTEQSVCLYITDVYSALCSISTIRFFCCIEIDRNVVTASSSIPNCNSLYPSLKQC